MWLRPRADHRQRHHSKDGDEWELYVEGSKWREQGRRDDDDDDVKVNGVALNEPSGLRVQLGF
jgi:hypothetical protein